MRRSICFILAFIFFNKLPSADCTNFAFSTSVSPTFLPYIIASFAVIMGLIAIVIYFCLVRARADSSQDLSKRNRFSFKRKPSSAHSTGSLNSNELHQNCNSPLVPLTQPNSIGKNAEEETVQEILARLEYESRVFKLHLMLVD